MKTQKRKAKKVRKCRICKKVLRAGISSLCSKCAKERLRTKKKLLREKYKLSPSVLKKECDVIFSKIIRLRDGKCQKCGKTTNLQNAHLIPRDILEFRYDEKNCLTLCYKCHLHWAHQYGLDFSLWLEKTFPEKYKFWLENRHNKPVEFFDYNMIKSTLLLRLEELQHGRNK